MPRWSKITLKVLGILAILFTLIWIGGAVYITRNKPEVLRTVLAQLNKNINGKIVVGNMEPTLVRGFPGVSVSLNNVILRDSLFATHRHDLLNAGSIGVSLNIFSLIAGNIRVNRISINNANIYLYTDSTGYSNTSIFSIKSTEKKGQGETPAIEVKNFSLTNVRFIMDNQRRFKRFDFAVPKLTGKVSYPASGFDGNIKMNVQVNSFAFNTRRGSFLKDKTLAGKLSFHYDKSTKKVTIDPDNLKIGADNFKIGAQIQLDSGAFGIDIAADKILYQNVARLLAPNISSKLLRFGISQPMQVTGKITDDGSGKYGDPLIQVTVQVRKSNVKIPSGELTNANFEGSFTNRNVLGRGIGDENSIINFKNLTADYYHVPIVVDQFAITDLSQPIATGRVKANFPITKLNNAFGDGLFKFAAGDAVLDLFCRADIDNFEFTKPNFKGNVIIKGADITYLPRRMHIVNSALNLQFTDTDLLLKSSQFQLGKSVVNVSSSIKNFLNLYYTAPEKIVANLNLSSPQLSLSELIPFIGPRGSTQTSSATSMKTIHKQLGKVLELATIKILLNVRKVTYQKFTANNLTANIGLVGEGVSLSNVHVNHAGGSLDLSGNIRQSRNRNLFTIQSKISRVNVKEFFYSFDNFGQKTITANNLHGYLSALANINGAITSTGTVVSRSMNGKVSFNLKNALLKDFDPLIKAGKFAFANRDFNNIALPNLDGVLTIAGEKVVISPMQISSSVLNMDVAGVYSLGAGTNIVMDIPLRNPKRDEQLSAAEKKSNRMKGIVLHLRASDGDDGKVKIRWNKDHLKL